jgi:hypothetical protein
MSTSSGPRSAPRLLRPAHLVATALLTSALLLGAQCIGAGASPASDRAQAKKMLLVLSDMPHGWKTEKGSGGGGSSNFPGATQLASCIGVPSRLLKPPPPEVSPYFENKDGSLEVQDSVSVFSSATTAKAELGAMSNTKTPACMTTIMNGAFKTKITASAGEGATVGTITVTRVNSADFGPGTTGLVMSLPISEQGVSITAKITAVYFIKGKFGQQVDFNSYGPVFPASVAKTLTATASHRL